jgi:hypothetical protein
MSVDPIGAPMSEDCLRLNVFTPLVPSSSARASSSSSASEAAPDLLPVFVWLYGGDNTIGSTESCVRLRCVAFTLPCIMPVTVCGCTCWLFEPHHHTRCPYFDAQQLYRRSSLQLGSHVIEHIEVCIN